MWEADGDRESGYRRSQISLSIGTSIIDHRVIDPRGRMSDPRHIDAAIDDQ
jgi:hypothetical protein